MTIVGGFSTNPLWKICSWKWVNIFPQFSGWKFQKYIWNLPPPRWTKALTGAPPGCFHFPSIPTSTSRSSPQPDRRFIGLMGWGPRTQRPGFVSIWFLCNFNKTSTWTNTLYSTKKIKQTNHLVILLWSCCLKLNGGSLLEYKKQTKQIEKVAMGVHTFHRYNRNPRLERIRGNSRN